MSEAQKKMHEAFEALGKEIARSTETFVENVRQAAASLTRDTKESDKPPTAPSEIEIDVEQARALMRRCDTLYAQNSLILDAVSTIATELEHADLHVQKAKKAALDLVEKYGNKHEEVG